MIRSFRDKDTEALFRDVSVPRFRAIERVARRRLLYLHRATQLADLHAPPGNRLEALKAESAANTAFVSMTSGESALPGVTAMHSMRRL